MPEKAEAKSKTAGLKRREPAKAAPKARVKAAPKPRATAARAKGGEPSREMYEKLQHIASTGVKRQEGYESRQLLRQNIARHQVNHQHQMEHDRLLEASVKGPLAPHAEKRLVDLKKRVVSKT